jgi:hypothetical protein
MPGNGGDRHGVPPPEKTPSIHERMTPTTSSRRRLGAGTAVLLGILLAAPGARAVAQEQSFVDWNRSPVLPTEFNLGALGGQAVSPANQPNRIRLFRVQPGFLSDPVGLDRDDIPPDGKAPDFDPTPDFVTVAMGNDNPYFDFRQRGDPGGIGFFKVNSQVQLFDSRTTSFAVGLQAVTPAGLQFDGLPERQGPTVFTPAFSVFQAIDDAFAIQGFVGKHVCVNQASTQWIDRNLQYGVALQRPLTTDSFDPLRNFYVSVGAVGQYRLDSAAAPVGAAPLTWDVLPGFHWKVAENWWVSGGVLVPMNSPQGNPAGRWQLTCSFQF